MTAIVNVNSNVQFVTRTVGLLNSSTDVENISQSSARLTADADQEGAMLFIVVTVCVYSLGIVAFIASHLYKKRETKIQDMQISDYLRSVHSLSLVRTERMDTIRHVQFKLPKEYRSMIKLKCYSEDYWTKSDDVFGGNEDSTRTRLIQKTGASHTIQEI